MTKRNVLVTGALGFLGRATVDALLQSGYSVWGLDLPDAKPSSMPLSDSFNIIEGNILDDGLSDAMPENIEYTIHLAGLISVSESFDRPKLYQKINVDGTRNILQLSHSLGVKRFVFSSTAAVYGQTNTAQISEEHPLQPINPYGQSKRDAESTIRRFGIQSKMDTVILRFFNLYGPSQPLTQDGIIPSFVNSVLDGKNIVILGDRERSRSYLHVKDAARALLLACEKDSAANQTINICSNVSITTYNLAKMILEVSGRKDLRIEYQESEVEFARHSSCKGDLAREVLGFEPYHTITEELRNVLTTFF
ncbi:MAG: NAD-dependent epimerase/dehydratase family protein [Candidatus Thorarchaeota archaeon]